MKKMPLAVAIWGLLAVLAVLVPIQVLRGPIDGWQLRDLYLAVTVLAVTINFGWLLSRWLRRYAKADSRQQEAKTLQCLLAMFALIVISVVGSLLEIMGIVFFFSQLDHPESARTGLIIQTTIVPIGPGLIAALLWFTSRVVARKEVVC